MLERIVANLTERGCLVDPQAAAFIAQKSQPEAYLESTLRRLTELPLIITMDTLAELDGQGATPDAFVPPELDLRAVMPAAPAARMIAPTLQVPAAFTAKPPSLLPRRAHAAEFESEIRILKDSSTAPPSAGDVRDFVRYFNDRLESLTKLLRMRREVANAVRIKDAARAGKEVQLIGLVKERSKRPTGHRFLTLEDATGEIDIMVGNEPPTLPGLFDSLLDDEVVGIVGRPTRDGSLIVADNILRPDVPFSDNKVRPEGNLFAGFLGDVHVGSKTFLEKEFRTMVRWLQGDQGTERERQVARSLKYLVFPGDLVDGVGVYPGQQDGLAIEDVFQQYQYFAKLLEDVPEHISFVLMPGNHDASRPNEPQPALAQDIKSLFSGHEVKFVSNPSMFSLHGVSTLTYHGYSMIDFATSVPGLKMDSPIPIMKQMLQSRHVAPAYGGKTPISPEERDSLVIDQVPDIFVTGHVHVAALDRYKSVTLVNGGTWQSQTDYQRMQNLVPTPARLPVVNLSTLTGSFIDFSAL